jgi:hypothetical protein
MQRVVERACSSVLPPMVIGTLLWLLARNIRNATDTTRYITVYHNLGMVLAVSLTR